MGKLVRSATLLAAALLVLELRRLLVIGDALSVPLVALLVLGFIVSVAWNQRGGRRSPEPAPEGG